MNKHSFTEDINLQELINNLEIGENGIYLAPHDKYGDKAYKATHYGLSKILLFAFDLLDRELTEEYLQISFNDLYDYIENAKNILTDMHYREGDRTIPNDYNITIYENPKNYSVVNLKPLLPITEEQLKRNYIVPTIHIVNNYFITAKKTVSNINIDKLLTPREKEAFYGESAKITLGLLPKLEKSKKYTPSSDHPWRKSYKKQPK